ncbi:MAG: CHAT domain-containing protein [Vicinamibacterales bacterium]
MPKRWVVPFVLLSGLVCGSRVPVGPVPALAAPNVAATLEEADRLAWLTNWSAALPLYAEAEASAEARGDLRHTVHARFGRLRGEMQVRSLGDVSEALARELARPLVARDPKLRLRGLTAKGDVDLEWDVLAARHDWEQALQVATALGDAAWTNRAAGELGMIAFLTGDTGAATTAVQRAMDRAKQLGDVGGELRYMSAIANGILLAGYPPIALGFTDRALGLAAAHPETGFPFVAYSTKVLTLMALARFDEADHFARAAMAAARSGDRRIKAIELQLMLARIAEARHQPEVALRALEDARAAAAAGHVVRLLADAEAGLAEAYRQRGDLTAALRHATAAVQHTTAAGSRFTLPIRLGILADIEARHGRLAVADRLYEQATDVVEGIMVNVPSRSAQARLVGVMSTLYASHFGLAAGSLANAPKAYRIIERARGRALADVLRIVPGTDPSAGDDSRLRAVSALQLRLMRARTPAERARVLAELWEAEQRATMPPVGRRLRPPTRPGRHGTDLVAVQRALGANEVILEYVLLEPRSYCLVVSPRALQLVALPSKTEIARLGARFRDEVRNGRGAAGVASHGLFAALVAPVSAHWRSAHRVFVVPDGPLHTLPFEELVAAHMPDPPAIAIAPSAGVLALLRARGAQARPDRPLLAIGGVLYEHASSGSATANTTRPGAVTVGFFDAALPTTLPTLPRAEAEVRTVAGILGPSSVVLVGAVATEAAFKRQDLSRYEVLHIAAHGFADPKFPDRAAIVLLSDGAAGEDGLLQPREIARYTLRARLVVLSACDTTVGALLGQEGVLNVARAFLVAGAGAELTTLWPVSDATAAALMRQFYEQLASGADLASALQRSKQAVLARFGPDALASVAAFQIVGDAGQRLALVAGRPRAATKVGAP